LIPLLLISWICYHLWICYRFDSPPSNIFSSHSLSNKHLIHNNNEHAYSCPRVVTLSLEGWAMKMASAGSDEGWRVWWMAVWKRWVCAFCRAAERFEIWTRWFDWFGSDSGRMGWGRAAEADPPVVLPAERRGGRTTGGVVALTCFLGRDVNYLRKIQYSCRKFW
jgi:hypothetical protein